MDLHQRQRSGRQAARHVETCPRPKMCQSGVRNRMRCYRTILRHVTMHHALRLSPVSNAARPALCSPKSGKRSIKAYYTCGSKRLEQLEHIGAYSLTLEHTRPFNFLQATTVTREHQAQLAARAGTQAQPYFSYVSVQIQADSF